MAARAVVALRLPGAPRRSAAGSRSSRGFSTSRARSLRESLRVTAGRPGMHARLRACISGRRAGHTGVFTDPARSEKLVVLRRGGRASAQRLDPHRVDAARRARGRAPADRPAVDPGPPGDRRGRDHRRADPDRARGPQLPGQRPQQRAAGLHQQRRLADPAVQPDRRSSSSPSCPAAAARATRPRSRTRSTRPASTPTRSSARRSGLNVPDEMKAAQQNFVLALQMRRDGIASIAARDPAGARHTDQQGRGQHDRRRDGALLRLRRRSTRTTRRPLIAGALHAAGIAVGGLRTGVTDRRRPVPARPRLADADLRRRQARRAAASQRVGGKPAPGLARPRAGLGQRRRDHAADRLDEHRSPPARRRRSRSTSPTAGRTRRPTSSAR